MFQFLGICFVLLFFYILYKVVELIFVAPQAAELSEANQKIGEMAATYEALSKAHREQCENNLKLQDRFDKLQFNKISADVKLGQKYENILPFLSEFPYPDAEVRGLFNPIDLIVFTDDEVVFMEVKTGAAQLSEKQRKIRDNIKAGTVRFETFRMNEKGVTVK
jgi:predicted Holliday junction resolvase-like endonuclease